MKKVVSFVFSLVVGAGLLADGGQPGFYDLMGGGAYYGKWIHSAEEKKNFELFQESYEKNRNESTPLSEDKQIPRKFHVVWLGPKDYPESSMSNLYRLIQMHPNWQFIFWSDRERKIPFSEVEVRILTDKLLGSYIDLYYSGTNWGEKSDLVRLLVLEHEGGIYLDHDVVCRKSFEPLAANYEFFTGLLEPKFSYLNTLPLVRNSIVGAGKASSIIQCALGHCRKGWMQAGERFPGSDFASQFSRAAHRGFGAFHFAVYEAIQDPSFSGIVLPAGYFDEIDGKYGIYAIEEMKGAWYRDEMTYFEDYLFKRSHKLMLRLHYFIAAASLLFLVNVAVAFFLLSRYRRLKRKLA